MNSLTGFSDDLMKNHSLIDTNYGNAVLFENVTVGYRIPSESTRSFKHYVISWLTKKIVLDTFLALKGIDLLVKRGEVFGLIGHNGAGKSTLLKIVAKVLKPSEGRIIVRGKIAPLLGIGAGFHPELTGRENVFLNGAILGMSQREMEEKFNRIIDFAGLGKFIDAPMRTYSSGMWSRLGFAVATSVEPEVLVIDEVLAVGDEKFRRKSSNRIQKFCEQGATVMIASHSLRLIGELCQRVAWLDHGRVKLVGEPKDVIQVYRESQK
jgi:ABC-2 type transport system ATP-binding protein/lipopolysaccharide transport system ATP-binding protein